MVLLELLSMNVISVLSMGRLRAQGGGGGAEECIGTRLGRVLFL